MRAALLEGLRVADPQTLEPVRLDGRDTGEMLIRGNTVMMVYLKDPEATAKAFARGWFLTA